MALFPLKLIPDDTKINFIAYRWIGFGFSGLLVVATIFLIMTRGLNLGIDFAGGILLDIATPQEADLTLLRNTLNRPEFGEVSLQTFGDPNEVLIRIEVADIADQAALVEEVKALLGQAVPGVEYRQVDYVGPTVGRELIESGIWSLGLAMLAMMIYIWFRFEWQFGMGGILALIHDTIAIAGFYAITGFDFGLTSVAAILTVIGYSINDSVVIYDRIRENMRKYKKMPMAELLNKSINDTLSRTVVTGLTTILAALSLALFGGDVIKGFSYALVFGVVIGTYSSIFISAPVLIYFGLRPEAERREVAA